MVESDSRLEYVRGLLEGSELTEEERRDKALTALVMHMTEQAEAIGNLRSTVEALRAEVADLRAVRSAGPEPTAPNGLAVYCAVCGAAIPLLEPWNTAGPNEVMCQRCGAEMILE